MTKPLPCGDCNCPAHFHEGEFMGCCSAGHCENEGHKSVEDWNAYTIKSWEQRAANLRRRALADQREATQLDEAIMKARAI